MSLPNLTLPVVVSQPNSDSSDFLRDISRFIAPMILFAGGVWLLSLRISGWSMLLGLPAIQVGIVFIILGFDNSAKKTFSPSEFHIVKCEVCGDPTAAPLGETHEVCPRCRVKRIKHSFFRDHFFRT